MYFSTKSDADSWAINQIKKDSSIKRYWVGQTKERGKVEWTVSLQR